MDLTGARFRQKILEDLVCSHGAEHVEDAGRDLQRRLIEDVGGLGRPLAKDTGADQSCSALLARSVGGDADACCTAESNCW